MATKSRYVLKIHPLVNKEDIPDLPAELRADFFEVFLSILKTDPYNCERFSYHTLKGRLRDYRVLEIEWLGNPNAYRLVYRIYEKPAPKRVLIISFAHHSLFIGMLFEYCYFELNEFFSTDQVGSNPPIIERSAATDKIREITIRIRSIGHSIILLSPCVVALLFNWYHAYNLAASAIAGWWLGVLCMISSVIIIYKMNQYRIMSFRTAKAQEQLSYTPLEVKIRENFNRVSF